MTIVYQTVTAGNVYSRTLNAPNAEFFLALNLPQGLSINQNSGVISGELQQAGRFAITILARGAGGTGAAVLDLTVTAPPAPFITSVDAVTHETTTAFSYQITASSPTAILSYGATSLPTGLSVDTGTGLITGTPTSVSNDAVVNVTATVSATNAAGTGSQNLIFTLQQRPVITSSLTPLTLTSGVAMSPYTVTATKSPTSFNAFTLPSGLTVNTNTGVISGTPVLESQIPVITFPSSDLAGLLGSAGTVDGTGAAARVDIAFGTSGCFDASGNYYFCQPDHVLRKVTPAGVVTTLAGLSGQPGSTNGTGSSARFNQPNSVCINPITQELFVSDRGNYVIRKVTLAGVVTTFAGTAGQSGSTDGTGSAARFLYPQSIAGDSLQNIFVRDNTTLRIITSSAVVTTLETGLAGSGGVSCDSLNNIFYFSAYCLKRRTAGGLNPFLVIGDCNTLPTSRTDGIGTISYGNNVRLLNQIGPIVQSPSEIYFAGPLESVATTNAYLRRLVISPLGSGGVPYNEVSVTSFSETEPFSFVSGSLSTYNNLIYYSARTSSFSTGTVIRTRSKNIENSNVVVTTFAGTAGQSGSTDGTGSAARFYNPQGLASDISGNIFVADTYNNTIRKITPAGVVTTLAGSPGQQGLVDGTGSAARFRLPTGITVAPSGNIYVADTLNGAVVRKITPAGVVTTLAQNVILSAPTKLCVDSSENVYGCSWGQHSLFKITPAGTVSYLRNNLGISTGNSGIPGAYGIGNVGVDTPFQPTRQMDGPSGIAFGGLDENGRSLFYVTESGNAIVSLFRIIGDAGDTHRLLAGKPPRIIIGPGPTNYTAAGVGSTDGYSGLNLLPLPTPLVASGGSSGLADRGGICIASPNLLYFCDSATNVIRSLQPTNYLGQYAEVRTVAGIPGYRGSANGTGVENVSFSTPSDICYVASTNTLYVADRDNHTIRKIIPPTGSPSSTSVTLSANNTLLTGTASKTFNVNP
jgi:hypothetical protein